MTNTTCPYSKRCPNYTTCKGCGWEEINFNKEIMNVPLYLDTDNVKNREDEFINYYKQFRGIVRQILSRLTDTEKIRYYSMLENAYTDILKDYYKLKEILENGKSN